MFDGVTIRVTDRAASERCYALLLGTLGWEDWGAFAIVQSDAPTRGLHLGFAAPSRAHIERFWETGVDAGYRDDGPPGPRPQYSTEYWGAFLLDPDGNSIEAARHENTPGRAVIDHVWVRVADLDAAARFYDALLGPGRHIDGRVHYGKPSGSFALVRGEPTRNLEWAFLADTDDVLRDPDGNTVRLRSRAAGTPGSGACR